MNCVYYNENDPKAAAWLRELIKQGHIAAGEVDERSIEDVTPNDVKHYTQCHFFAGIGGWSYALRLAGWSDDRPVWTGSCPCQPFSTAGKGKGFADERHLWPAWFHLIAQCRPEIVLGEQVASKDGLTWLDLVQADLEGEDYSGTAVDICAAGVGAPHIRQRLYWMAHSNKCGRKAWQRDGATAGHGFPIATDSEPCELGNSGSSGSRRNPGTIPRAESGTQWRVRRVADQFVVASFDGELGDGDNARLEGWGVPAGERTGERAPWAASDFVWCRDGKWRPIEPGTFPLAHGVSERVGLLRGYGNAIVPQVAAAFIEATGLV